MTVHRPLNHRHIAIPGSAHSQTRSSRTTTGQAHGHRYRSIAAAALSLLVGAPAIAAGVLPTGGTVTSGSGSMAKSGQTLTITQTSARLATDWQSFDIGRGYTVQFVQPSSTSVALNRVLGPDVSTLQGALKANGQVFLVNPNGVLFTPTARVDVGGLVASTLALTADDTSAGRYTFDGTQSNTLTSAGITNQGVLRAAGDGQGGGTVAMIAARIDNTGTIEAYKGNVLMGAGSKVTLDLGGPVKLNVDQGSLDTWIANGGAIRADGGLVLLSSRAAGDLTRSVINHTGITEAQSLSTGEHGEIILFAHEGTLQVGGSLRAAAGFVETSGKVLAVQPGTAVEAAQWLVDPVDLTIDNNLASTVQTALGVGNVTLTTSGNNTPSTTTGESGNTGDITVNGAIQWSANTTLTLSADRNIYINQPITATGSAGALALYYGQGVVSGVNSSSYTVSSVVSLRPGANFSTKLGPNGAVTPYTVITSLGSPGSTTTTDLQGINGALNGNYVLGADIDASATATWNLLSGTNYAGFTSIGTVATPFTGKFDGLGHTVNGLSQPWALYETGLFGKTSGTVSNVGVTNVNISKAGYGDNASLMPAGAVAGTNAGALRNVRSSGTLNNGGPDYNSLGGLVGLNTGSIESSSSSVAVNSSNWGTSIGGLVGTNSGSILFAYATGAVIGNGRFVNLGGLVGTMTAGTLDDTYATGAVTSGGAGNGNLNKVGGLMGLLSGGAVTRTYATGRITNALGAGLIYQKTGGSVSSAFWDLDTTARSSSAAGIGKTTTQMKTASTFTSAGFSSTSWGLSADVNSGYPVILKFYPNGITTTSVYLRLIQGGSVYGDTPSFTYALYNSSTGGNLITDAAPTGTVTWSGAVPTSTSNIGAYSLTYGGGITLGNSLYALNAGSAQTWTVSARPITVTATGKTKTYGDTDPTLTYALTSGTLVGTDTLSVTLSRAAGENAGSYTINASALANSNYVITAQNGTFSIDARPITVTADSKSKTYGDVDPALTYAVTGGNLVGNDTLSGALSRAAGENVGRYTIDASALANGNYLITAQNGTLSIGARPLTVTVDAKSKTYGNVDPAFTYAVTHGNLVGNDTLSGALSRAAGENVGSYTIDASALTNGNYLITAQNGTLSISARPLTVTADAKSKTYGNVDPALTYTVTSGNLVGNDTLSGALSRAAGENVGSYTIDASALANGNYLITAQNGTLSIGARPLTVTADSKSKTYGDTDPALTYAVTSGNLIGNDTLSGALARSTGEDVGRYTIDASALANGNYAITAQNGTLSIGARPVTVVAEAKSKTYGDVDPALTYAVTQGNLVGNDTLTGALKRSAGEHVGSYTIDASALANGNYLITAQNGTLSIGARPITVAADAKSKTYGNTDPALTYAVISGNLVGNDTLSGALSRTAGENVGSYTIDASALANGNYLITAQNGTLSIGTRPITVTADSKSKTYGNADPTLSYAVTSGSLVGNDTLTGALKRTAGENVGSYSIDASALTNGNYLITAQNGTLSIGARPITVTVDNKSKTYGNADPALTYAVTQGNLVGTDTIQGALLRTAGENVGSYTIDARALANGNYLITAQNGVLTIDASPVYTAAVSSLPILVTNPVVTQANTGPTETISLTTEASLGTSPGVAARAPEATRAGSLFSRMLVLRGGINRGVATPLAVESTESAP